MYILVQSSGTPEDNEIVDLIKEVADDEFGLTVDYVNGYETEPVIVYGVKDNILKELARFNKKPDIEVIRFYLEQYYNEGDDD